MGRLGAVGPGGWAARIQPLGQTKTPRTPVMICHVIVDRTQGQPSGGPTARW
jgi:hypothetical protein